jgi:hypothetical protein
MILRNRGNSQPPPSFENNQPLDESSDLRLLTHPDLRHVERIKLIMQCLAEFFSNEKVI